MKVIGGFHELLIPDNSFDYHSDSTALTNGRACIRTIIRNLNINHCYLPNYTCDAVYHPFDLEGISYDLYNIDQNMEPVSLPKLEQDQYFYYINYFGVKHSAVKKLYDVYGDKLIIDNTHDFFKKRQFNCWSFTSARKYCGVPDGAFLYAPKKINIREGRFNDFSLTHSVERLKGNQSLAFRAYQEYEKSLSSEVSKISLLSERMLSLLDVDEAISSRRKNFHELDMILGDKNNFILEGMSKDDVPFAYPFLPSIKFHKEVLYKNNIFIPALWADPIKRNQTTAIEKELAENLMPLPIDERYNTSDMRFVAEQILKVLECPM